MKRALVTGGSGDIGAAISRQLAADGFFVFVHAHRHFETAQNIVEEIIADGGHAQAIQFDVTQREASEAALNELLEEGAIQVVVNNAGAIADTVFPAMSAAQWHSVIDVSLHGFFHVTQPLLLPMLRTRWGRIINITSVAAQIGNRGQVNYAAAKGAVQSATKALALEVASRGVTVNAVAPGIIATAMSAGLDPDLITRKVALQRCGTPQEVAALVAFLASDKAAYITGQTISINGGMT